MATRSLPPWRGFSALVWAGEGLDDPHAAVKSPGTASMDPPSAAERRKFRRAIPAFRASSGVSFAALEL
jgi:hypothetical protein